MNEVNVVTIIEQDSRFNVRVKNKLFKDSERAVEYLKEEYLKIEKTESSSSYFMKNGKTIPNIYGNPDFFYIEDYGVNQWFEGTIEKLKIE